MKGAATMKKEITYTEQELKNWFEEMKKKYPHSMAEEHFRFVEMNMFDHWNEENNLKNVLDKS